MKHAFKLYLTARLLKHILFPIGYWYAVFTLKKKERPLPFSERNSVNKTKIPFLFLVWDFLFLKIYFCIFEEILKINKIYKNVAKK